jgi:formate dehydrogenase major subunit
MATRDTGQPASGITRRDFLKTTAAATAVAGCGFQFAFDPEKAAAYENNPAYKVTFTTCPYCSASCGQRVVKEIASGDIVDLYGDFQSPWNSGGLCAKGAGTLQLVNNSRRIGAWTATDAPIVAEGGSHPVDDVFLASGSDVAYFRDGNDPWEQIPLTQAMEEIADGLVAARGALSDASGYNSKGVAFFGSSHMNNESNYIYRKMIAMFGSSNTEHQARI